MQSPGKRFREALQAESPLQITGTINAYVALMAKDLGLKSIYLSGAGVANSSYGLPDLGMTTLDNVIEDASRITAAVDLPLLVDIDTGWGSDLMISRSIKAMERAGVAAVHIEDQAFHKRCGHRDGKTIVSIDEMVMRIEAAVKAKSDPDFVIMARTDALANEGMEGAIKRCLAYKQAGADMLFPEAFTELEQYAALKKAVNLPILANITEFGKTELFTRDQLKAAGVDMILYPLSANRAMNAAAKQVLKAIRNEGTQRSVVELMQTRDELYETLDYRAQEKLLNQK